MYSLVAAVAILNAQAALLGKKRKKWIKRGAPPFLKIRSIFVKGRPIKG